MKHLLLGSVCLLAIAGPGRAFAPAASIVVTNSNDSGAGSLRQAILISNASVGVRDEIDFNIPGTGVQTITPATPLPDITDPVIINGQSQPGYDNVHPQVQLDGSLLAAPNAVLTITGGTTEIYALGIIRGPDAGIRIKTAGLNNIGDCTIGTDPTGTIALGNATHGIVIEDSPGNGVPFAGLGRQNVIGGNGMHGVFITGAASLDNMVAEDAIGTDWMLTTSVPNGGYGVLISDASGATVQDCIILYNGAGGVAVQGAATGGNVQFNTLSANGGPGITILGTATGIRLLCNILTSNAGLGIDLNGDGRTPNDAGDTDSGPNRLLNYPVLSGLTVLQDYGSGRYCTFTIRLQAEPSTNYVINPYPCNPGRSPGDSQISSFTNVSIGIVTDASGFYEGPGWVGVLEGFTAITATATDSAGNTSELADPLVVNDLKADSGACGGTGAEALLPLLLLARRRLHRREGGAMKSPAQQAP